MHIPRPHKNENIATVVVLSVGKTFITVILRGASGGRQRTCLGNVAAEKCTEPGQQLQRHSQPRCQATHPNPALAKLHDQLRKQAPCTLVSCGSQSSSGSQPSSRSKPSSGSRPSSGSKPLSAFKHISGRDYVYDCLWTGRRARHQIANSRGFKNAPNRPVWAEVRWAARSHPAVACCISTSFCPRGPLRRGHRCGCLGGKYHCWPACLKAQCCLPPARHATASELHF